MPILKVDSTPNASWNVAARLSMKLLVAARSSVNTLLKVADDVDRSSLSDISTPASEGELATEERVCGGVLTPLTLVTRCQIMWQ